MSRVLTVRIEASLLSRAEARAARLGLDRAGYVRNLIERDLAEAGSPSQRRFASEDLVGAFRLGGAPTTNARTREQLRRRGAAQRETHR